MGGEDGEDVLQDSYDADLDDAWPSSSFQHPSWRPKTPNPHKSALRSTTAVIECELSFDSTTTTEDLHLGPELRFQGGKGKATGYGGKDKERKKSASRSANAAISCGNFLNPDTDSSTPRTSGLFKKKSGKLQKNRIGLQTTVGPAMARNERTLTSWFGKRQEKKKLLAFAKNIHRNKMKKNV